MTYDRDTKSQKPLLEDMTLVVGEAHARAAILAVASWLQRRKAFTKSGWKGVAQIVVLESATKLLLREADREKSE